MNVDDGALRQQLLDVSRRMVSERLVAGASGNVSVRTGDGTLLATPSGQPYDALTPADLSVVDPDGRHIEGRPPTSELPLHLGILAERHDVAAIVHTHSPYAAAHSVARLPIPFICNESLSVRAEQVLVTEYAPPGTQALGDASLETFAQQPGSRAILLANHGVVAIGDTLDEAFAIAVNVEWAARIHYLARTLGHVETISREDQLIMGETYGVPLPAD